MLAINRRELLVTVGILSDFKKQPCFVISSSSAGSSPAHLCALGGRLLEECGLMIARSNQLARAIANGSRDKRFFLTCTK